MQAGAATHSAAEQLLALLAGTYPENCDWAEVRRLATWHAVAELLAFRTGQCLAVPSEIKAGLCATQHATAQNNLLLASELLRIMEAFHGAGIEALAYKGPALAVPYYGDISRRSFGDLDVLLRPENLSGARDVLEERGFVPWQEFAGLTATQERAYLRSGYHFQYSRPDGSTPIELHWNIAPHLFGIAVPMEQLFRRAVSVQIGGRAVLAPCAEDHLVLLCIHGAKHMWDKLRLIADVAQLIAATAAINFDQVLRFSSELHARRMVLLGLNLAKSVFGTTLPDVVMTAVNEDTGVARLTTKVINNLPRCRSAEEYRLSAHRFYFDVLDRPRAKLRYLYRLTFEPSLNDARLLGSSPAAAKAGGWLRPFRLAGAVMRHSFAGMFRRS